MALDEALYELTGAGLVACAAGLGLVVPSGAVRTGDAFVGFLSQRGAWGEINRLVEELKRDILRDMDASGTTAAGLSQQVREAVTVLEEIRPETDVLRAALVMPGNAAPGGAVSANGAPANGGPILIAPATRIAAQMIARAAAANPPNRHIPSAETPTPGPSHGAQALLHKVMTALLSDPGLLLGLAPDLREFLALTSQPAAVKPLERPAPAEMPTSTHPQKSPQMAVAAEFPARSVVPPAASVVGLPERGQSPMLRELVSTHGLGEAFAAGLLGVGVIETLERIRAARDLTPSAYGRFLRTLESQDCPPGATPLRLDEMAQWLTGLITALTKPSNEDSDTRRLKSEAAKALAQGDLEASVQLLKNVRRSLRDGRRRIEERLREDILLLNQQMASEAGVIARQAEMELTRRDYASAAELFAEARDSLPGSEIQAAWLYGMRQGEALFRLGDEFDDTHALREATRAYAACLGMTGREEMPKNWVAAQCGLALAHQRLAERETDPAALTTAVEAWRSALAVLEILDEPGQTLVSRRHLARALVLLGERESENASAMAALSEAATLYRAIVSAVPRGRSPHDWAEAQMGLGSTLLSLDERVETPPGGTLLADAVTALEAASSVYDREQAPTEWSQARMALGNAHLAIGERGQDLSRLSDAVACFEDVLARQARAAEPRQWAQITMNLANALAAIAELTGESAKLDAAAGAYRQALEELQGEDDSLRRAIAELNLGTVLVRLAGHRDPQGHRREAMTVMMSALQIFEARKASAFAGIAEINLRNLHKVVGGGAVPQAVRATAG
jgi:tetratricopeptide (TPR) repeat protein